MLSEMFPILVLLTTALAMLLSSEKSKKRLIFPSTM